MLPDDSSSADSFYRDFEDRFRGGRDEIQRRLEVYLPFILPLHEEAEGQMALDLGCGRGEWLELLGRRGVHARGVDLDVGMLEACHRAGLDAVHEDALEALRAAADESLLAVTGFHLAEHLPFGTLRELLTEAHRALQPGGVLVLETPNPENLTVGTEKFYLDPSHLHPLPPDLLQFAVQHAGFELAAVLRLQEDPALASGRAVDLLAVIQGVSPDYAVVAQKSGSERRTQALEASFAVQRGLTLSDLSAAFHRQHAERQAEYVDRRLSEEHEAREELLHAADDLRRDLQALRQEVQEQSQAMQEQRQEVRELRHRYEVAQHDLVTVRASTSWRMTAPVRAVANGVKAARRRSAP